MSKVIRKFYDKDFVPKNLEELYCSGWKEYILYHIRKYSLNDINNSSEDILQDMMVLMSENNYIEKYDPSISEFTVYLHTFIKNFMSKLYAKEHKTKNGSNIINYISITDTVSVEADNSPNVISADILSDSSGDFTDYVCLVQSLEKDLNSIKTTSQVDYAGMTINKSPLTVYNMLKSGYDVKEIAEVFGTSKQFIYTLRRKIMSLVATY